MLYTCLITYMFTLPIVFWDIGYFSEATVIIYAYAHEYNAPISIMTHLTYFVPTSLGSAFCRSNANAKEIGSPASFKRNYHHIIGCVKSRIGKNRSKFYKWPSEQDWMLRCSAGRVAIFSMMAGVSQQDSLFVSWLKIVERRDVALSLKAALHCTGFLWQCKMLRYHYCSRIQCADHRPWLGLRKKSTEFCFKVLLVTLAMIPL